MIGILADINVEGHFRALHALLNGPVWEGVWRDLGISVVTFEELGLPRNVPDDVLWRVCQERRIVLFTSNRNDDGPDSLEAAIRTNNTLESLPVITLPGADRVFESRAFAERVVERLLEHLIDLDRVRGAGRLFVP